VEYMAAGVTMGGREGREAGQASASLWGAQRRAGPVWVGWAESARQQHEQPCSQEALTLQCHARQPGSWVNHAAAALLPPGAGVIPIAHNSGGPRADIVVDEDTPAGPQHTGYLAESVEEYCKAITTVRAGRRSVTGPASGQASRWLSPSTRIAHTCT
jgi:hypothetical protein